MSQKGSEVDGFLQRKQKSLANLEQVVIAYPNVCNTSEVQT